VQDPVELASREKQTFAIEVKLPGLEKRKITDKEWPRETKTAETTPSVDVKLEQDINTPPKVFAFDLATRRERLLLDLNPQFQELEFGKVEAVEWKVAGIPVIGGLYLPPDYTPGKKYPLVIQTHGFERSQFSMDGLSEWGSAFAARPLAAKGVVVLQVSEFMKSGDEDRIESNRTLGATISESYKNFYALVYETAIDLLDGRGIIDRDRVGIVGFSRTVCFVGYTLTHSEYHFAAASLVDGIDCGYLQYLVYPSHHWDNDQLNGGKKPFGDGLKDWLKKSPSFSLDRVNAPVRLLELQPRWVLQQWEWWAGLRLQNKPVDYVLIPDRDYKGENHLLVQSWERKIAQEGLVDWFCFWLKGEQDSDPKKSDQYSRWRRLQNMQAEAGQRGGSPGLW
jgi:dipeptidyl aminopeptidase/acylaminoacyl peptidase